MTTSAQLKIAEDTGRSRLDRARLRLIVPVGVIAVVAVACLLYAVMTLARRANEASLTREQQLVQDAIAARGARVLREVESAASTASATRAISVEHDRQWMERHLGNWLETFFDHDLVLVVDGSNQVQYARSRISGDAGAIDLPTGLSPVLDLLRGRRSVIPSRTMPIPAATDPRSSGRSVALIEDFLDRPAIVAAVSVGSDNDLAHGNGSAPVVVSVKYIDDRILQDMGSRLQLAELRMVDDPAHAGGRQVTALTDAHGNAIAHFAWQPTRPGGQIASTLLPFVAIAIAGFALLAGLVLRHIRHTAETISAGETQLRHLALHDPVCGLPNRIYFGERLETVIAEVRRGGPRPTFYIDLDHFKDVNDTLGHHVGDELILNVTQRLSHVMRGDDLVARLGGDEFAIITTCASDSVFAASDCRPDHLRRLRALRD